MPIDLYTVIVIAILLVGILWSSLGPTRMFLLMVARAAL